MDNICKYRDSEIVVSSGQLSEEPASVKDVLKDLDVFEEEMGVLLDDLSKVDVSISSFKDRCDEVADEINNLGNTLALFSGEHSNKTKGRWEPCQVWQGLVVGSFLNIREARREKSSRLSRMRFFRRKSKSRKRSYLSRSANMRSSRIK